MATMMEDIRNKNFKMVLYRLLAWSCPAILALVAVIFYMVVAWFPNHRYLVWVEEHPQCDLHLPDVLLDSNPEYDYKEWTHLTAAHDTLPGICLLTACVIIICSGDLRVWNRYMFSEALIISMINLCQQSTLIPSSYGYKRCTEYLGITSSKDDFFQVKATGSCVAMIWSGHVFHAMLGSYMAITCLERRYPWFRKRLPGCTNGPLLKTFFVVLIAGAELTMILIDKAHYTQDVEISIIICLLVFTNDHLEYYFFILNPFMRWVVGDRPYKRARMKADLKDARQRVAELEAEIAALPKEDQGPASASPHHETAAKGTAASHKALQL